MSSSVADITAFYAQEGEFVLSLIAGRVPVDDQEDVAADVWLRALRWPPTTYTRAWLRSLITSAISDHYRRRRWAKPLSEFILEDSEEEYLPEALIDRDDVADQVADRIYLTSILSRLNGTGPLSEGEQRAVVGHAIQGRTVYDLAAEAGVTHGGISARLASARRKLAVA